MVTYVITSATLLKNVVLLLIFLREVNSDLYPRFKYSTDICQAIEEIYFKYPIQKNSPQRISLRWLSSYDCAVIYFIFIAWNLI